MSRVLLQLLQREIRSTGKSQKHIEEEFKFSTLGREIRLEYPCFLIVAVWEKKYSLNGKIVLN